MVKCKDCKQEMENANTCIYPYIGINGKVYHRDVSSFDINKKCHDCGIVNKRGNVHHFGCDVERCPRCKGQIISCSCNKQKLYKENTFKNYPWKVL